MFIFHFFVALLSTAVFYNVFRLITTHTITLHKMRMGKQIELSIQGAYLYAFLLIGVDILASHILLKIYTLHI